MFQKGSPTESPTTKILIRELNQNKRRGIRLKRCIGHILTTLGFGDPQGIKLSIFMKILKKYSGGANISEKAGFLRQNRNFGSTGRQSHDFVGDR